MNNAYWLKMAGKNYRCQPLAETELRKFREFLFQPVRTEKLEYLAPPEVRPFVLKTFLWNRVFNLHLNRSNWKFCLNGKRQSIIGITWRPPDFGPQNSSWENNTIFISLITSIKDSSLLVCSWSLGKYQDWNIKTRFPFLAKFTTCWRNHWRPYFYYTQEMMLGYFVT